MHWYWRWVSDRVSKGHGQVLSGLEPMILSTFMLEIYTATTCKLRSPSPPPLLYELKKKALKIDGRQCVAKGLGLDITPEFEHPALTLISCGRVTGV